MPTAAATRGLATVRYRIDPRASRFTVQAFATGILSSFGHNPIIAIRDFDGHVQFEPGTYEKALVHMKINASGLEVLDEMNRNDRERLEREMFNEVLDVAHFPTVLYESRQILLQKDGESPFKVNATGELTLHGVTHVHTFEARVLDMDSVLRVFGDFSLRQSDYGIRQFSAAGGALRLKDELKFRFELVARRENEGTQ